MLLLDKFFSTIKNAIKDAADILEITGVAPPVAALDTIEGTNRYIYDELQLVSNSVLYPCRVEYHTAYDFRHLDTGTDSGYPFFVERTDGLYLVFFRTENVVVYNFATGSKTTYDETILQSHPYADNSRELRDLRYNNLDGLYELSVYHRRSTPPYDYYHAVWKFGDSFQFVEEDNNFTKLYYRGFNTYGLWGIEMFRWSPYFNLQNVGSERWLSLGHHVFVFDSNWSIQRRIFLNNSFLTGEEAENMPTGHTYVYGTGSAYSKRWGYYNGCKSYIYNNRVYVADIAGNIEVYQVN